MLNLSTGTSILPRLTSDKLSLNDNCTGGYLAGSSQQGGLAYLSLQADSSQEAHCLSNHASLSIC